MVMVYRAIKGFTRFNLKKVKKRSGQRSECTAVCGELSHAIPPLTLEAPLPIVTVHLYLHLHLCRLRFVLKDMRQWKEGKVVKKKVVNRPVAG